MKKMKQYQFNDVPYMKKEKAVAVENEEKGIIGRIEEAAISGCEKKHVFSYTNNNGYTVRMGIKKRSIKNLLVATYVIKTERNNYFLKDKPGNSLLYFCVEGDIDGKDIRIEENWSKEIEVKIGQIHIATIKTNDLTLKTTILTEDNIWESSIHFAVTVLMYFMYKIYKNESEFIESVLFD